MYRIVRANILAKNKIRTTVNALLIKPSCISGIIKTVEHVRIQTQINGTEERT